MEVLTAKQTSIQSLSNAEKLPLNNRAIILSCNLIEPIFGTGWVAIIRRNRTRPWSAYLHLALHWMLVQTAPSDLHCPLSPFITSRRMSVVVVDSGTKATGTE